MPIGKKVINDMLTEHLPPIRSSKGQKERWEKMCRRKSNVPLSQLVRQLLDEEYRKTFPDEDSAA